MRLAAAILAALVVAAPAAAAELKQVDLSGYPAVTVTAIGGPARAPALRENDRPVAGLEAKNLGRSKSVVLAIDNSQSMAGGALADAVAAVRRFVGAKRPADRVAVVAFGSQAVQLTRFSASTIDVDAALRELTVDAVQGTALNDAIVLGSRALAAEAQPARVLVLVSDGTDVSSSATAESAVAAAQKAGVAVYTIGIESSQFAPDALEELAVATGGGYHGAASSAALSGAYDAIAAELSRTWRLSYVTAARPGDRIELAVPGSTTKVVVPGRPAAGSDRPSPSPLLPPEAYESGWSSLAVGAVVGALVLFSVALLARARRISWLRARLLPHVGERPRPGKPGVERERFAAGSSVMRATENALGHLDWWSKTTRLLERGDVPLRTVEFLYLALGAALLSGLVGIVATGSTAIAVGMLAAGGALPFAALKFRAQRRVKAFENQLPDLLLTLAASLKAGHSFKQGLQTVVDEGQPPASKELTRVLAEVRLGRPMEDALNEMADRVGSKNLRFVITAVTIQSQVGGSLAGLFDMVAETVRQRQQFTRKIKGLTAMGRASAYVLIALPFALAGLLTLVNSEFMAPLYDTSIGHKLIFAGLGMMALGSLMLKKIVSFRG